MTIKLKKISDIKVVQDDSNFPAHFYEVVGTSRMAIIEAFKVYSRFEFIRDVAVTPVLQLPYGTPAYQVVYNFS